MPQGMKAQLQDEFEEANHELAEARIRSRRKSRRH